MIQITGCAVADNVGFKVGGKVSVQLLPKVAVVQQMVSPDKDRVWNADGQICKHSKMLVVYGFLKGEIVTDFMNGQKQTVRGIGTHLI